MYVCICNGLTEKRVRTAAAETGERRCARTVYNHLGCKPQCGLCLPFAKNVIASDEEEAARAGEAVASAAMAGT